MRTALAIILLLSNPLKAATYYVDWTTGNDANAGTATNTAWKTMPGMANWAGSWSTNAGDVFVFKTGETWPAACFPAGMYNSGTTITTNANWGTGANPVWDGEGAITSNGAQLTIGGSNQVVRGIKFYRNAASGVPRQGRCILIYPQVSNVIDRCVFEPYDSHVIVIAPSGEVPHADLYITDNDFSHAANSIEIGHSGTGSNPYKNLFITGNAFHDMTDMLVDGDHGDGIHLWSFLAGSYSNIVVANNSFYGMWKGGEAGTANTAQIYLVPVATDVLIYNNRLGYNDTNAPLNTTYMFSPGLMVLGGMTNVLVANNSIISTNYGGLEKGAKAGIQLTTVDNFRIYNNVIMGSYYGITRQSTNDVPGVNWFSDHNIFTSVAAKVNGPGGGQWAGWSLSLWQSTIGQDLNSLDTDPLFADFTAQPMDLRPLTNSPAIGAATNLNAYFTTDAAGLTRGTSWDIGAYEFDGSESEPPIISGRQARAASVNVGTLIVQ